MRVASFGGIRVASLDGKSWVTFEPSYDVRTWTDSDLASYLLRAMRCRVLFDPRIKLDRGEDDPFWLASSDVNMDRADAWHAEFHYLMREGRRRARRPIFSISTRQLEDFLRGLGPNPFERVR